MRAKQQIFRVRREYNQWVNNQTLEDYALRFTAKSARRWSSWQVSMTALGATAFLALEAIGGAITLNYGFTNAVYAMLAVGAVLFVIGLPISYHAARQGLDIDLLTRGAGFGYLGSTVTSLIYASFTFIFFAIEAAILAMALKALLGIPLYIGYVLCSVAVIPIVTHGITAISRFQVGTQGLWLALQLLALLAIAMFELSRVEDWTQFQGLQPAPEPGFNLLLFGAASAVLFAFVAQIGEQVDYLRFLPARESTGKLAWWSAMICAGPGWIFIGIIKMLIGSFLAWLAFSGGKPFAVATDPTYMYQTVYGYFTQSPTLALILAGTMVIISQMKINVTNAYAGSIAWSNFFSRLTHSHPGRVVWLVFNVLIALLLMELGIYQVLENILSVFAIVAVSWLGTIAVDLSINLQLGLRPQKIEFKRAHLYDVNPVGVGSMLGAAFVGLVCYSGWLGLEAQALAHFLTLITTVILAPAIAWLTGGRYYIARESIELAELEEPCRCCICENRFESEDMSYCPAYAGAICSLCCSLDSRCMDSCKPGARFSRQIVHWLGKIMPEKVVALVDSRMGHYLAILSCIAGINAALLTLVYYHIDPSEAAVAELLSEMLWTLFFVFMIIAGVIAWLFLLSQESRLVAEEESQRQTQLLMREIQAHGATDRELQNAKENAEAANLAKSRYLGGISHELRTPLQSILGYAQILGRDPEIPDARRDSIDIIRRSGEYLNDLIDGLLEISRIEAGRLDIQREQVDLHTLLAELVDMFRQQANAKSIDFNYRCSPALPRFINSDEKRLRQILINLLSNAIKFTDTGSVSFDIKYRSHVAEFIVEDSGRGIASADRDRIFQPFERVHRSGAPYTPGTGLGLTIVRLLSEMMGGDVSLNSQPGVGTRFVLQMMLSRIDQPSLPAPPKRPVIGYHGARQHVMVVDDEPHHRQILEQLLTPLGFNVQEAADAAACLSGRKDCQPDLYLLDIAMPGTDGLGLAKILRSSGDKAAIIMISGNAHRRREIINSNSMTEEAERVYHDDFMTKPIRLDALLARIGKLLQIKWVYGAVDNSAQTPAVLDTDSVHIPASHPSIVQLKTYAELGYLKGVREQLTELAEHGTIEKHAIAHMQQLARDAQLEKMVEFLERSA
ncbi:response regulator [Halieaceae bacterium IMCC14734]|uniref:histidine kinase n=1 Tax=Candidatus Litorirhabdus singularis TaxID=2518993 RepID=A0ABT3TIX8_9GAMM|nr:ATP-binding protein [Candidatus Litorirhabdus singularis]MCX2982267.1 response regulator [Candidatus Litorirhabdus singularis]